MERGAASVALPSTEGRRNDTISAPYLHSVVSRGFWRVMVGAIFRREPVQHTGNFHAAVMKGGKAPGVKGGRVEREIVKLHQKLGLRAERVPLSGAMRYQGNQEDVDIYPPNSNGPLCCQVKALGSERGTKTLLIWLGDADALFLRYDADEQSGGRVRPPVVVLPWETWEQMWEWLLKRSD